MIRRYWELETPCYVETEWLRDIDGEYYGKEILLRANGLYSSKWQHATGLAEIYPRTGGEELWGTFDPFPTDEHSVWERLTP